MDSQTKTKAVNLEDLQISVRDVFNKGFGNSGTCTTAAATPAKEVTLGTIFSLVTGATILVKFANAISVANATLAVTHTTLDGTTTTETAKAIYLNGSALEANIIQAGASILLRYNGTQFDIIGGAGQGGGSYTEGNGISISNNELSVKAGSNLSFDANGNLNATDTTYSTMGASGSTHAGGLVPDTPSTAGTSKYLREDGTWAEPTSGSSTDVAYDTTNKKITETIDGTTTDVVYATTLVKDGNADLLDGYTVIDTWATSEEHYDLDDLTTPSVYVMTDSTKKDYFDNKAYDDIFVLKVSTNAEGNTVQRFIRPNSTAYQRRFTDGAFNSWNLIEKALPANMADASITDHVVISEDWHGRTTSSSRPSSVGWYRIGEVDDVFDVIVYQRYSNSPATSFRIFGAITAGSGSSATYRIAQIGGAGNDNINKVRVTFESSKYYFEFRYASTVANHIYWKFLQGTPFEDIQAGGGTEVQTIDLGDVGSGFMLTTNASNEKLTKRLVLRDNYENASGALTIDAKTRNISKYSVTGNISGVTINNMANGQQLFVLFYASSARTVTIAHNSTYKCAKGEDVSLSIPAGGNRVVCFTKNYDEIFVSVFANV